jgi:hypothetical protein
MCYIHRAVQASGQEKKTIDLRKDPSPVGTNGTNAPQTAVTPPQPPKTGNGNALPLDRDEMIALASGIRQGVKKAESIPLRLDAYDQAVEVEEAHKASLQSRLSLENIQTEWAAYASSIESNLLRMALTGAELRLEGHILMVTVKSITDRNHVQGETLRLLDTLRHRLHDMTLKIEVAIDETKAREQVVARPARALTTKEKLERLKEANPMVDELLKRFDLKLDE